MGLLVWLPLIEDLNSKGVEKITLKNNGSSSNVTIENNGKIGQKCYYLNGKTLSTTNFTALNNTLNFSACCWVKFIAFPSNSQCYCISVNNSTSNNLKFILGASSTDGVTGKFRINALSKSDVGSLSLNTWYHLAVCISDKTGYMYINGEQVKKVTGLADQVASTNLVIGGRSSSSGATSFSGTGGPAHYNDVRIYDYCLSPREVKQIAQGLVLHYPMNNHNHTNILNQAYTFKGLATKKDETFGFPYYTVDNSAGTSSKDTSWGSIITAKYGDVYTVSFYARSSASNGVTSFLFNNTTGVSINKIEASSNRGNSGNGGDGNCLFNLTPQWQKCQVTYTFTGSYNSSTADLTKSLLFRVAAGGVVDLALPKLEKGSVATPFGLKPSEAPNPLVESDCSGYGNNGERSAEFSYTSNKDGRFSNATSFSDGKRIRATGFTTEGWDDLTMMAWVRPRNTSNGTDINTIIIGGAYLAIRTSTNQVTTYCYGKNPAGYHNSKTALTLNEWAHIAAVWDGKNGIHKIYINGKEDFSIACTGNATGGAQDKKDFGRENDGTRTFIGDMADARIYATALSANDIKTMYESSIAMLENGQLQAYEFNEEPDVFNLKMQKTGAIKTSDLSEVGYIGGMKVKTLAEDNSAWARIYWLNLANDKTVFTADNVGYSDGGNRFSRLDWIDHFKSTCLPKGYTKLNYIESTGTQYIDTGYYWTSENVQIVMDAYITSNASNQSLFGNEEYYDGSSRYFSIIPHGANGSFNLYTGTGAISNVAPGLTTRFTLDCSTESNKLTVKLNGTQVSQTTYSGTVKTYANSTSTDTSKGKIYIFSNHNSGKDGANPTQNIGGMRLYNFKMYDNGKIVRDFIPCKNSSGQIGLYDMVFGNFYVSPQGTAFTAGSASNTFENDSGYYEFMLTMPQVSATGFNRWQQASSPNNDYGTATGFKKIKTTWSNHFGPLTKITSSHKSNAVYATNTSGNWWSPIGQKALYSSAGIPGVNNTTVSEVELWVRIDNLQNLNKISMLNNEYIQAFNIKEI